MKFDYTIKNFRAFDAKGATFAISPITILTGTNSSGKSSMAKSFWLLNKFLSVLKDAVDQGKCDPMSVSLDFSDKEALLGSFDKCVNYYGDGTIELSYKTYSKLLSQNCSVSWGFRSIDSRTGQADRNGWVTSLNLHSDDNGFFLVVDFTGGTPRIVAYNRASARSSFLRVLKGISVINERTSDHEGVSVEKNGAHSFKYHLPDGANLDATAAQLNDIEDFFLSLMKDQSFLKYLIAANQYDSFQEPTILKQVSILDHDGVAAGFEALSRHSSSHEWQDVINSIKKDFSESGAESFGEYFRIKERFWIQNVSLIPGDFIQSIGYLTQINPVLDWGKMAGEHKDFATLVSVLGELSGGLKQWQENEFLFKDFCARVFKEVLFPPFVGRTNYISSSRAIVRRIYTTNDKGNSFDVLLQEYAEKSKEFNIGGKNQPVCFINHWLKEFGIGDRLVIEPDDNGIGIIPSIINGGRKTPLSELGYGVTQLFSILLNIEYAILSREVSGLAIMPFYIIVEEPEIHLHPRLQSLLADMFLEAYQVYNIRFIIETHSEYLIRKYQYLVATHTLNSDYGVDPSEIGIYYLYDADPAKRPEGQSQVQKIEIRKDGKLSHKFGKGFADVSTGLVLELYATRGQYAE